MSLPPKIVDKNGEESFGGSQMWLPDPMLLNSGCGIIAGLDAIMRLKGEKGLTREEYFERFFVAKDYIRPLTVGKNRNPIYNPCQTTDAIRSGRFAPQY